MTTLTVKTLIKETRPQFLTLVPAVLSVGSALAYMNGHFIGWHFALALTGLLLAHASVNVLNDYTDWVRGTDKLTKRTPFSGGSGMIPNGEISPRAALWLGIGTLLVSLTIGSYFIYLYPSLAWLVVTGALLVVFYTPVLTKVYITELFPGIGLGIIPVLGAYIINLPAGQSALSAAAIWASIPAGILVCGLLWINEIPDYEADLKTGRRHAVILLGQRNAAIAYAGILVLAYASIVIPVIIGVLPILTLLGLLTIPIGVKAAAGAIGNYSSNEGITPALGQNVLVVLATPVLMSIGLIITKFLI